VKARHSIIGLAENLKWMTANGFNHDALLANTGIDAQRLNDPHATVEVQDELAFYQNVIALSQDPLIMYKVGFNLQISSYGIWGLALLSSPNVAKAIDFGIQYIEFSYTYNRIELFQEDHQAGLRITPKIELGQLQQKMTEKDLAAIFVIFKALIEIENPFKEIKVAWPKPALGDLYQDLFLCPVSFSCPLTEIIFEKKHLARELLQNNALTVQMCKEQLEEKLPKFKTSDSTIDQVNDYLTRTPCTKVNIEECAKALKMSSRHLRRKITDEGSSFKTLQDQFRRMLAEKYLRFTDMNLEEIAERLGYSDAANFSNAFKRWTGISPRSFAKNQTDN